MKRGIADESPSSLGGWLFADLFLLLIVVGFSAFMSNTGDTRPVVETEKASGVSMRSAVINGVVAAKNQETKVAFEWGTTPTLDEVKRISASDSPVSGEQVNTPFRAELKGLDAGTTYYFRAIAENESGKAVGRILSFETLKVPPTTTTTTTTTTVVCTTDGPRFLKDPFVMMRVTKAGVSNLLERLAEFAQDKNLAKPKVAVAVIKGWTTNPAGTEGSKRARDMYNLFMEVDSSQTFFYEDTALEDMQNQTLPRDRFDVILYLVDLAEDCRP
jgi:hypothetical protein